MVAALRDSNHGDLKEIGRWTWENWSREPSNIMEINIEFSIKISWKPFILYEVTHPEDYLMFVHIISPEVTI